MTRRIVAADIGGTHARFALATLDGAGFGARRAGHAQDRRPRQLPARLGGVRAPLGRAAAPALAISFAGPVGGELLKLTNNPWVIRPALIPEKLGVSDYVVVNDFGAVAHAVAAFDGSAYTHLCGPDEPLPARHGHHPRPGHRARRRRAAAGPGGAQVIETEGGHIDFAPLDSLEDRILTELRKSFRRVSVERILSGRGLMNLYEALAASRAARHHPRRKGAVDRGDGRAATASPPPRSTASA
jgi:glucokinase